MFRCGSILSLVALCACMHSPQGEPFVNIVDDRAVGGLAEERGDLSAPTDEAEVGVSTREYKTSQARVRRLSLG